MRFNCLKPANPQLGYSLLFNTKSPEGFGTNIFDLERMKGYVDMKLLNGFEPGIHGLGIQRLNHWVMT